MKLSSARALKQELLTPAPAALAAAAAVGPRGIRIAAAARGTTAPYCALGLIPRGRNDYRLAVRVQRKDMIDSPAVEAIRKRAKGEIEVRATGRIVAQVSLWPRKRYRPALAGTSVGHFNITAGTIGYFARSNGRFGLISNNHVLADSNAGAIGDVILQPGPTDDGERPADEIALLDHFVRIDPAAANFVDCAFAAFDSNDVPGPLRIREIGKVKGTNDDLDKGMRVSKYGRTTALTRGRITAFEMDNVTVDFDALGVIRFDDQIEIEGSGTKAFSAGGDSGSLIVDGKRRAIGLLFAGGDQGGSNGKGLTYACPIGTVLEALNAELLD